VDGDTAHFIHIDGNLLVADSAAGTVFLNFMIQGSLNISGAVQPAASRPYPAFGAVTVVGLTDHVRCSNVAHHLALEHAIVTHAYVSWLKPNICRSEPQ
jgi:hypothetical protein